MSMTNVTGSVRPFNFVSTMLAGFFVVAGLNPAGAQALDCNVIAQVPQYGGCEGFCKNFLGAWGAAGAIGQCVNNCNNQLAQCAGGGGGGGEPNCQWYSKGEIRKYICRIN